MRSTDRYDGQPTTHESVGRVGVGRTRRMVASELPPTISVEEAADLCGIGRNTAYQAAHRGELPSLRFGRRIRVPTARLLELLGIEDDHVSWDGES